MEFNYLQRYFEDNEVFKEYKIPIGQTYKAIIKKLFA